MVNPKDVEAPALDKEPEAAAEGRRGAACFLNQDRICGADCMAHLPQVPDGDAFKGEQWAHCLLLVNADRTGRHLVILANVGKKYQEKMAESIRTAKAPGVG